MLMMCGCIGKSGGGWAHYVGQEKLRQFFWIVYSLLPLRFVTNVYLLKREKRLKMPNG
jgi:nitrate reductase alpha subunit